MSWGRGHNSNQPDRRERSGGPKNDLEVCTFLPATALAVHSAGLFRIITSEQPTLERTFTLLSLGDESNPLAAPELHRFFPDSSCCLAEAAFVSF